MSGLWLLLVLAIWGGATYGLWLGARRFLDLGVVRRPTGLGIFALAAALWLSASFWYAGGRKIYYDAEVNRLCRVDGGVRVYETVKLPADKFDKWGQINFYKPTQGENALGVGYVFRRQTDYIRPQEPGLLRIHTQIVRRTDNKILGESVFYKRGGGDLPGPWQGSTFLCPVLDEKSDVLRRVFLAISEER